MTRKRKSLTDEEQSLWNRVTQKIKPLKQEKKHQIQSPPKAQPPLSPRKEAPLSLPSGIPPSPPSSAMPFSSTHRIKRVRKVKIEARLDLHGLTRDQAQLRLAQFLHSCQNRGCLWVLVITGKGQRNVNAEQPYGARSPTLRALVPQWLESPSLRPVVSAYTTAKSYDGGDGALYVRLKRLS